MQNNPPNPNETSGGFGLPLALNAFVLPVAYGITAWQVGGDTDNAAASFFFVLVGLLFANVVAGVGLLVLGKAALAKGILLSMLLISLIGVGLCGYNLSNMRVNGN